MRKTLTLICGILFSTLIVSQIPVAEFSLNGNLDDEHNNFSIEGSADFDNNENFVEFDKSYFLSIDPQSFLDDTEHTIELKFRKHDAPIPPYGIYNMEGLLYRGLDTEIKNRQFSLILGGENPPHNLIYQFSTDKLESIRVDNLVEPDTWYHIHIVQSNDTCYIYNQCELLVKKPIDASETKFFDEKIRFGLIPNPSDINVSERAFNGDVDFLKFYEEALNYEEILNTCSEITRVDDIKNAYNLNLVVMPNPGNDLFHVEMNENIDNLRLYDLFGNQLISISNNASNKLILDLSNLPCSTYLIIASDEKGNQINNTVTKIQ